MMDIIDDFLNCDVFNSTNAFSTKRQNSNEILDEALAAIDSESLSFDLGSPDEEDVNDLLLEDLVNIQTAIGDSQPIDNGDSQPIGEIANTDNEIEMSDAASEFDFDKLLNKAADAPVVVDFAINSENEVSAYIDCMEQQYPNNENVKHDDILDAVMEDLNCNARQPTNYLLFNPPVVVNNIKETEQIMSFVDEINSLDLPAPTVFTSTGIKRLRGNEEVEEGEEHAQREQFGDLQSDGWSAENPLNFTVDAIEPSPRQCEQFRDLQSDGWSSGNPLNFTVDAIEPPSRLKSFEESTSESDTSVVHTESNDAPKATRKTKNNEASRVHRAKKKRKFEGMFEKEIELETQNANLKIQIASMEKELSFLRELLLVKVAASSK